MSGDELLIHARQFETNLLNFFWRHGVEPAESEDLVQETYLRLWKYRHRYRETAKLTTFLFLIARQVWIDSLRQRVRRERRDRQWSAMRASESMPGGMEGEDVRWALARLPEPMREVVELAVFQDLPYAEIAEILSVPVGTVKSRMFNALRKLREVFDER